jgi:hypothetical protein
MKALREERLFEPFIDPTDGVLCLPAASSAAEINILTSPHGLRFPLVLDESDALCDQVAASPFAPASSRFGPYCDNITGLNWELPDGRRVRVGERVVKSTTGYDLLRFLLGTNGRYGRPVDYVLRLRPECDVARSLSLRGDLVSIRQMVTEILKSSWIHWIDSLDFISDNGQFRLLRIAVNCPTAEWDIYMDFLSKMAERNGLLLDESPGLPFDGRPDFVIKTSPEFVIESALRLSGHSGAKCVALCYCGVVHVFLEDSSPEAILAITRPLEKELHAIGGDWSSRHVRESLPVAPEADWISTLRKEWGLP